MLVSIFDGYNFSFSGIRLDSNSKIVYALQRAKSSRKQAQVPRIPTSLNHLAAMPSAFNLRDEKLRTSKVRHVTFNLRKEHLHFNRSLFKKLRHALNFSLRTKLILLTTFIVTATMAYVMYVSTIRELHERGDAVESQMGRIARNIASMQLVENQSWKTYQNYITQLMPINEDIVYIAIYDERNWLRAHTLNPALVELPSNDLPERTRAKIVQRLDKGLVAAESRDDLKTLRVNIQSGDRVLGSVHVGFSLVEINDEQSARLWRNLGMALVLMCFFNVIAVALSRRLSRPLERLSGAMNAIAKGDPERKVAVEGKDEIAQLARNFNQMVEGLRERKLIEQMGREMSAAFELGQVAEIVRSSLAKAIRAPHVQLYVRSNRETGTFYEITDSTQPSRVALDKGSIDFVRKDVNGFSIEKAPGSIQDALVGVEASASDIVLPMLVKKRLFGFVVFGREGNPGDVDERKSVFAATLAGQAAIALENALLSNEVRKKEKLQRELDIAHEVQQKLLPETMPRLDGFQFDAICLPAHDIGGDYFDFFAIDTHKLGVVVADVSGKGTSAAFYMAELKGMMSSLAFLHESPKKVLCEVNRQLHSNADRTVFATILYGVLDSKKRTFTFVRAGHDPLLHIREGGKCLAITPSGIGVGLESGKLFRGSLQEHQVRIKKGEALLLYTDGITESMNGAREEFGEARLLATIAQNGCREPRAMRDYVLQALSAFSDGARQHDDLTMVAICCS